ncbi:MAG: chromosomal replication initiator protein DnaA [Proteobacteria bacterium]|nr:chromosomal replication initiator protein DnaA [Pseudomonadota bacterium]
MRLTTEHWNAIHEHLKAEVGDSCFESWLLPLKLADEQPEGNTTVAVKVPTRFMRDWVIRHYTDVLRKAIVDVTGLDMTVDYIVTPPAAASAQAATPAAKAAAKAETAPKVTTKKAEKAPVSSPVLEGGNILDPRYTFDNFVTGKSNEFAYHAAKRIAESDDIAYNPFFLHGGVGLGKTHLMHAIAWQIHAQTPKRRVMYTSSEKFVYQFVRALKDKKTIDFKDAFRSVDVLMIDDIQFIAGKDASQEEFFNTLNALFDQRKQVIVTADKSPLELDGFEDRLRSRLGWGLTTEVHRPDLETRVAILESKAQNMKIDLPRDVALFLADKIASNVRELEGALNRLVAHTTLVHQPITLATTQELLKDLFRVYNRAVTIDEIQMKVAEFYRIKLHEMHSSRRSRDVARPRQIAMYLAKTLTSKSYPEIGKAFGGRDHTTVMHAVKHIEGLRDSDPSLKEDVKILENMLTTNA